MGFTFKLTGLKTLTRKFGDPQLKTELQSIAASAGVAALVSQAIADNFEKEGPGWAPLKGSTLRGSVKKSVLKRVQNLVLMRMGRVSKKQLRRGEVGKFHAEVERELVGHESDSRASGKDGSKSSEDAPNRKILNKTGLLKKTATIPNFSGSSKGGASGSNIYKVEGSNLTWGTNLVYASIHNRGFPQKNISKREFMVIRPEWKNKIDLFVAKKAIQAIKSYLTRGRK